MTKLHAICKIQTILFKLSFLFMRSFIPHCGFPERVDNEKSATESGRSGKSSFVQYTNTPFCVQLWNGRCSGPIICFSEISLDTCFSSIHRMSQHGCYRTSHTRSNELCQNVVFNPEWRQLLESALHHRRNAEVACSVHRFPHYAGTEAPHEHLRPMRPCNVSDGRPRAQLQLLLLDYKEVHRAVKEGRNRPRTHRSQDFF
mmetsp:Transcript_30855/g.42745  ORF Transcript_30855/g.42745 Transcript_30855/m.42745 type:complete len:201 (-) Transcript_30855:385-987(-)